LVGVFALALSLPAYASGDPVLVYYAAGAFLLQAVLLVGVLLNNRWREIRASSALLYFATAIAAWVMVLNARANLYPLFMAIAVALLPVIVCVIYHKLRLKRTKKDGGN
jgi:hypothetical protein